MLPNSHTPKFHFWLKDILFLSILFIIFYTVWLGSYPLFIPDEGRYSEVAREMIASGDYITPRVSGIAFLDKPILYYWLQALAMNLFGIKEWALRLFPALLGVIGCLMTYVCGRHLFNRRTGLIAATVLATTPLYFGSAHYANLDLEVAVFISCTLLCFISGIFAEGKQKTYFFLAMYLFAGLAFLTKGLIAIAFPGLIGFTWMVTHKRLDVLKHMRLILGIILFTSIALPWYILVQKANPEFLHFFFVTQQVTRFLSAAEFNNPTPFWFYLPVVLLGFLPWTLFLIQSIRKRDKSAILTYFILWASIIFIFFSIPRSKTIGYILPVFPALAMIVGNYIAKAWDKLSLYFWLSVFSSATFLLIVLFNASALNDKSTKPLVKDLRTIITAQDEVIHYFKFYQDVPLYLNREVTLVANWDAPDIASRDNWVRELWYGLPFQKNHELLINEANFWQRYNSEKRVFVFLNTNYFDQFKSQAHRYYIIGKYNDVMLLSNKL